MTERIKKLWREKLNRKGFSLVELLIVIAIMGVLAVIAFNAFGGVLVGSKKNADKQQAKNIERALRTFIAESGIVNVTGTGKFYTVSSGGTALAALATNDSGAKNLVTMLMTEVWVLDPLTNTRKKCGPYLTKETTSSDWQQFQPQWTPDAGGENTGWVIEIDKEANNPTVKPSVSTAASPWSLTYAP